MEQNLEGLLIAPMDLPYDPIVVSDKDGNQLFRVDSEGNVYNKGRLVGTDEELIGATKQFIKRWTECLRANRSNDDTP